ncbi:MAG: hypothetical protein HYX88_01670 [Chloroflexi bacterium]|nr:hypothetical protein [Chloroflexota bacterium]
MVLLTTVTARAVADARTWQETVLVTGEVWFDGNCNRLKDTGEELATVGEVLISPRTGSTFGLRISGSGRYGGALRIGDAYLLTVDIYTLQFPSRVGEFSPHFVGETFLNLSLGLPEDGGSFQADIPLCLLQEPRGDDFRVANGHFFTQTSAFNKIPGRLGYAVTNADGIPFWDEFQRLAGAPAMGYPVSQRFVYKGFATQAFQKGVMQWQPGVAAANEKQGSGRVLLLNVFDELHDAGKDDWLLATRATPRQLESSFDAGKTREEIVRDRLALLEDNPAIREHYLSTPDPLLFYGLPTSRVEDMGNHYAIRLQRAVIQQWKEDMPWAKAGEVTVANGGDIAKEAGVFPAEAMVPEGPP